MEWDNKTECRLIFWKNTLDDTRMKLLYKAKEGDYTMLDFHR